MPESIRRHQEAMYVAFAGPPHEVSEEFADNFIADYSLDDNVIGLEILWPDTYRSGSEQHLLAFGIFGVALAGLSWRYDAQIAATEGDVVSALHKTIKWMIGQSGLDLLACRETPENTDTAVPRPDLTITDGAGHPLLCAVVKRVPFARKAVQHCTDVLRNDTLESFRGAIGVCVFIDETGHGHRNPPVEPGCWIDWPKATLSGGDHVWAHISVIPPVGSVYPWLPKGFLPARFNPQSVV